MNTAQTIAAIITEERPAAVTLEYGYVVKQDGGRTFFPPASIETKRQNKHRRCTYLEARYPDGSALVFRWSEKSGARYTPNTIENATP